MNNITIKWQASDGYVGGDRPQYTELFMDDFIDCDNVDSIIEMIGDAVNQDFREKVCSYIRDKDMDDAVAKITKFIEESNSGVKDEVDHDE